MPRRRVDEATFSKASVVTIPSLDGYLKPVTVYGKSTQAGTPTPDVPVPIVSTTGNVTVRSASKNLLGLSVVGDVTSNGVTRTVNADGSYTFNGTSTGGDYSIALLTPLVLTGPMVHSVGATIPPLTYFSLNNNGATMLSNGETSQAFTGDGITVFTTYVIYFDNGAVLNNFTVRPQIEVGSTATTFEKNTTSTQTLPLGATQLRSLPNGVSDRIYKDGSTWKLEQNVGLDTINGSGAVLTKNADPSATKSQFYLLKPGVYAPASSSTVNIQSDKFQSYSRNALATADMEGVATVGDGRGWFITINKSRLSADNGTGLNSWLATNNITLYYGLATPTTTTITDPTLITALENIRTYQGVTNITASTPISGVYLPNSLRTAATNRVAVQDMKSSLSLRAANSVVDCGTDFVGTGDVTITGWIYLAGYGGGGLGRIYDNGKVFFYTESPNLKRIAFTRDGVTFVFTTMHSINMNNWYYVTCTSTVAGLTNFFINGVANNMANQAAGAPEVATTNALIGNNLAGTRNYNGLIKNLRFYNSILTAAQINTLMNGGEVAGATRIFNANEGAGTVLYDTSGNNNHGTITAGTYTADVPTKKRELVGGNMVKNGDFEYAPPFTAATTGTQVWIDGTAAGSTTNNLFGWGAYKASGSGEVKFDPAVSHSGTNSIKVSTTAIASRMAARSIFSDLAKLAKSVAIAVQPSTSYTVSCWMKTSVISGDATSGARVRVVVLNGDGSFTTVATSTLSVTATTNWTYYSETFTTGATIRYAYIQLDVNGSDGTGTLVMDAWFDDITLTPTVKPTRGIAG